MGLDSGPMDAIARGVIDAMESDHGRDQQLTAAVTVAATRTSSGEVYIRCMAVDGDGVPLAPWHLKGILRYLADHLTDQ